MDTEKMEITAPPIAIRVGIYNSYSGMLVYYTEYGRDRNAAVELADQLNGGKTFDLRAYASQDESGKPQIILARYGHKLGVIDPNQGNEPQAVKDSKLAWLMEAINHRRGLGLRAAPEVAAASDTALQYAGH